MIIVYVLFKYEKKNVNLINFLVIFIKQNEMGWDYANSI